MTIVENKVICRRSDPPVGQKLNFLFTFLLIAAYKTTTILLEGKRVRLQLWDASGQGRFCTIIRSYSRGAQGVILVYDITNKWSFDGIDRWLKEVEEVWLHQYSNM